MPVHHQQRFKREIWLLIQFIEPSPPYNTTLSRMGKSEVCVGQIPTLWTIRFEPLRET